MTNRLKGCVVVFENDIREDDAEEGVMNAIRCIRGVAAVTTSVSSSDDWMNRERVSTEMRKELYDFIRQWGKGKS